MFIKKYMIHFIILAAGKSERFKKKKNKLSKQFIKVNGVSPLEHLMKSVSNNQLINSITLVINKGDRSEILGELRNLGFKYYYKRRRYICW